AHPRKLQSQMPSRDAKSPPQWLRSERDARRDIRQLATTKRDDRSQIVWPERQHYCHIIVMVTRAKLTESPAPNLGPRTTRITPFAFRNRATPTPPTMAPPAATAI